MRPQVSWTTATERSLLIDQALELLENVGMRFGPSAALETLAAAGAHVDRDAGVARLPRDLVERAVATCPREVLLAGATEADDVLLDGSAVHFLPSGTPTKILDEETGRVRSGTVEDVRRAVIVADAMPAVDVMWAPVGAADLPEDEIAWHELLTAVAWSPKHFQHEVTAAWQLEPTLAACAELSGGPEAFRARPRVSFVCCTHSPLDVGQPLLDLNVEVARHGGPILVYPMPIAGAEVSTEAVMNEVTVRVGWDGDFLRQKETSRRLRAGEVFQPEIATRTTVEGWEKAGRDELARARERAHDLVAAAEARGPVLPASTREALRAIAADAVDAARAQ
jgi:trimethylamine:corrinoid methyltransferase-like protein